MKDLGSRNGTLLNGERITGAPLTAGDTLQAGQTSFVIRFEGGNAQAMNRAPTLADDASPQERLLFLLRHKFQPLYAILDAARDINALALLLQSKEEYQSLYEGPQGAKLAQVAPYLVRLKEDSPLLEKLVNEGWGQSWGVYLTCDGEFKDVRYHLRHFLEVKLPDGKQVYFRFYDPRVLRVYLSTLNVDETAQFFGPIKQYLMEDEDPDTFVDFVSGVRGAVKKVVKLSPKLPALVEPGRRGVVSQLPEPR